MFLSRFNVCVTLNDYQLFVFKLPTFWHQIELSKASVSGDIVRTNRHTDARTRNFLWLYRVPGPQKRQEKS
jgi:hypothetical protein